MEKLKEIYMYLLGAFIVGCAITATIILVFHQVPETNRDMVNISLGAILGMAVNVVGYFYGSSKSSADKTESLKNMQPIPENSVTISKTETNESN